jgi:predicted ATP-binding protein involved in virulence
MHLERVKISNYRCFDFLEIDLDPELTVLVAPNGNGKTTVLDALRVAVWPFVKGFDLGSQTGKGAAIQIPDVRQSLQENGNMEPQVPSCIDAFGSWNDANPDRRWVQTRERVKSGTNTLGDLATKELSRLARELEQQVRSGHSDVTLPLITYLGTSRLWFEGRFTSLAEDVALSNEDYSRTSGYLNCLSYSSSFKAFTAWYGWVFRSYREEQILALENNAPLGDMGERFAVIVAVVKGAVDALVREATGWHSLEYRSSQNQQLVMLHAESGVLPVDMLSDGVRNTIAMVADLAFRIAKLNPHLGIEAAHLTPGIALIDEVDMFLHPSWQQTILTSLRQAFPRIQFIVSTHSPQVLTTVNQKNIRVLGRDADGGWQATRPELEIKGVESAVALNDTMKVNPVPPVEEARWLTEYTASIESGTHETADGRELRNRLEGVYGPHHPLILDADRLIRFQAFKLKSRV